VFFDLRPTIHLGSPGGDINFHRLPQDTPQDYAVQSPCTNVSSERPMTNHHQGQWKRVGPRPPLGGPCRGACPIKPMQVQSCWKLQLNHLRKEKRHHIRPLPYKQTPICTYSSTGILVFNSAQDLYHEWKIDNFLAPLLRTWIISLDWTFYSWDKLILV